MPSRPTATFTSRPVGPRALRREVFWHQLRGRRFRSEDEVRAYQIERIRTLLRHAAEFVPFYRDRFRQIGLVPEDVCTLEDYARIPLLTREDVLRNVDALWSRAFRENDLLFLATGGSTGVPMNYYKDLDYLDRSQVVLARSHAWAGKGRWQLMAMFGSKRELPGRRGELKRRIRAWTERKLYFDTFDARPEDLVAWVDVLRRYHPAFIYGYPSVLEYFARWLRQRGETLSPVDGVFVSAEILYPHQRILIEETFGGRVLNLYGSREVTNIGATCVAQQMHQVADWVLAEFVKDATLPAPRVVVTPLECFGMPLIRYANGDLGRPVEGQCPCGLPFPLMDVNVARVVDVFVTPEGTGVWGEFFTHLMYGISGIRQFQFHQVAVDSIRLLVVRDAEFDHATERKLAEVIAAIHSRVSLRIGVTLEYVGEIPRTAVGKHIFTRSDVHAIGVGGVERHESPTCSGGSAREP